MSTKGNWIHKIMDYLSNMSALYFIADSIARKRSTFSYHGKYSVEVHQVNVVNNT